MSHDEEPHGKAYDHRLMRRLLGYLRPYRGEVAAAIGVVLLDALIGLAGPYLTKQAIDHGIRHRNLQFLNEMAAVYLSVLVVGFGLGYLHYQIMQRVGAAHHDGPAPATVRAPAAAAFGLLRQESDRPRDDARHERR